MMSSRHLGEYQGNFYIIDEVLIANLSPAKARSHGCVFKLFRSHILAFSNRSNLVVYVDSPGISHRSK